MSDDLSRPCDYCLNPSHVSAMAYEGAVFDAVRLAIAHVVAVSQLHDLWRIGDGHGGWLHTILDEEAAKAGLETYEMARSRQRADEAERKAQRAARKAAKEARA